MAAPRVAMRNIKECLRLKLEAGLPHEKIARALQLSKGVAANTSRRRAWPGWANLRWQPPCLRRRHRASRAVSGYCPMC